jgi:hypothetical protein
MAVMASGVRGMGAPSHKGNSGPGTDAVQEETGEGGFFPIIDIILAVGRGPTMVFRPPVETVAPVTTSHLTP